MINRVTKIWCLGFLMLGLSSCASLRSVSLTSIPKNRKNTVQAAVEKWVFLGFNFDNSFVNTVPAKLRSKCEGGKVTGILTKHYTVSYVLVHKIVVKAKGFCLKG